MDISKNTKKKKTTKTNKQGQESIITRLLAKK